ncbi:MerR family transcriptional regulator [Dechloromonas sp. XY25]|uniref:MerR family transcriptional regulator n=1 Tax=Dechloromonas hankyongensis TaxID=2908002 RepID=A0ABS9K782_9RHOO|nr:MerR family transcriptional regulator [Dechloromonas hankyongensis]MCG2579006.1 MerR family transcriptional regulator [Dechloromonas hankyongensis]
MESFLTIHDVALRTGLTAHTLRYYERIGLIAPVARATGGQRRYRSADLEWIGFLMRLRATGMSISGMQEFARLRSEGDVTTGARRAMLDEHLDQLLAQIETLQQSAQVLQAKIAHYRQVEHSLAHDQPAEGKAHAARTLRQRARQT